MEAGREKRLSHITSVLLLSVISATFLPWEWGQGGVQGAEGHYCPSDLEGYFCACRRDIQQPGYSHREPEGD